MPYKFEIDKDAGVIRETWNGAFDLAELIESCHDEWAHPDYRQGMRILSDFRRARGRLTADEVLRFASWFCNEDAPPLHAIVVRRERALDFAAMFRMIRESVVEQTMANPETTKLFFSYVEADAWITADLVRPDLPMTRAPLLARVATLDR